MEVLHHTVKADNQQNEYNAMDEITFSLAFSGRKMLLNSLRFEADLKITSNGVALPTNVQDIKFDPMIGGHGFIDGFNVSFETLGQIENIGSSYPRFVKMLSDGSMTVNDCFQSDKACELRCGNEVIARSIAQGSRPDSTNFAIVGVDYVVYPDFSIKPMMCLNRAKPLQAGGDSSLRFDTSGIITLVFKLPRVQSALYGLDVSNTATYSLLNPRVTFYSEPDNSVQDKLLLYTVDHIRQSLVSGLTNISVRPVGIKNSVMCSFINVNHEKSYLYNSNKTESLNVSRLQFLYNNSTMDNVTYVLENDPEIRKRYIEALNQVTMPGHNTMDDKHIRDNDAYGVGLAMEPVDLTNQVFNIQVSSDASNTEPFSAHIYFNGLVQL